MIEVNSHYQRNDIVHGKGKTEIVIDNVERLEEIVLKLLVGLFKLCLIFRVE